MTTKETANGYKQKEQVTAEVFEPDRETEEVKEHEILEMHFIQKEHMGGGIDKKRTEWMTKTCKGILEVNEDTEIPDTFTGGGCSRGESSF